MDTTQKVHTRCPICGSKYMVPESLIGHRARCLKCKTTFSITEHNNHPTEDDILRWLNEGIEEYEFANRPRVISGGSNPNISTKVGDLTQSEVTSTPRLNSGYQAAGAQAIPYS